MSIGNKVRRYRESKGWSQEGLAFRLDVTQGTISNIESDKSIPNSILLNNIAKTLEVDLNELLNDSVQVNISNNQFSDMSSAGTVNQYNPVFNMQSPELLENIIKNLENISKLIDAQNKLLAEIFKK